MGGDRGVGVVVDAEHRASAAEEERAAVTEPAADVEEAPRADAVEHLAVAGGVQRQQRVGGLALDGTLSGESQPVTFRGDGAGSLRTPWRTTQTPGGPSVRMRDPGQARRSRRVGRAAPHPHARVARPRRRRGRRLRAARDHGRPALGRGRHRGHDPHVLRAGPSAGEQPRRRPRHPPGRPLPRVPAGDLQRGRPAGTARATGSSRSGTACRSGRRCGPRGPRVVFLHHVHGAMWKMVLPPNLADVRRDRSRSASRPRSTGAAASSRCPSRPGDELIDELRFKPSRVSVVPPGIDPRFSARRRAARPDRRSSSPSAG